MAKTSTTSTKRKKPTAKSTLSEINAYIKWATGEKRKKEKRAREEKKRKEALKKARSVRI